MLVWEVCFPNFVEKRFGDLILLEIWKSLEVKYSKKNNSCFRSVWCHSQLTVFDPM